MITDLLVSVMMVAGTFFMFLAGIGVLRMPDLLMRLHATTKAGTLGAGLVMLAVATHFLDAGVTARTLAIILFILLTAPVARLKYPLVLEARKLSSKERPSPRRMG